MPLAGERLVVHALHIYVDVSTSLSSRPEMRFR